MERALKEAKMKGTYDHGMLELVNCHILPAVKPPEVLHIDPIDHEKKLFLHVVQVDRGLAWEKVEKVVRY